MARSYSLRKFINDSHLWLGLASGLILFVVCLSGTVYTFNDELQEMADPGKYKAKHSAVSVPRPVDILAGALMKTQGGQFISVSIPGDSSRAYVISLRHRKEDRFGTQYHVNQYNGNMLGNGNTRLAKFLLWNMNLHRWLLMRESGGIIIVGAATIIFVVLSLTGLVLWFPRKLKHWKQGLKVKYKAGWKRVNHDLHNTLGFYSLPLLLIMALTGLCWSFEWYSDGVGKLIGTEVWGEYYAKPLTSLRQPGQDRISADTAVKQAERLFPYQGDLDLYLPNDSTGVITVEKKHTGRFVLAAVDKAMLNQYTADPLKVSRFEEKTWSEKLVALLRPLHIGSVYGLGSKILYFITCLIATSLPVTGTLIWINKLKRKSA